MRKAFVMGSNGPPSLSPLRYARADAMKLALTGPRCGFTVESPREREDPSIVRAQLYEYAESCRNDDVFICYFSGHGFLDKGSLFLLWDATKTERLLSSALPAADLIQAMRHCPAHNKLLILDCCHAGAAVDKLGLKSLPSVRIEDTEIKSDNHLILMASDRLEKAREIEDLKGSFLTSNICAALNDEGLAADVDADGRVSILDLKLWLERRASEFNRGRKDNVPIPYLFGQQKGDYFLTLGLSDWIPFELGWPDGTTMVVLPSVEAIHSVYCLGKYPVTNAQYRRYVESRGSLGDEPCGEYFDREGGTGGAWRGPFYPWRQHSFCADDQPVVCVSYEDACRYADWVNTLSPAGETSLPRTSVWDGAAFRKGYPSSNPHDWTGLSRVVFDMALGNPASPVAIDRLGDRTNKMGLSDIFGNVWEWCEGNDRRFAGITLGAPYRDEDAAEIRGGSFLDEVRKVQPFLHSRMLESRSGTRHSDLGFRIAARLPIDILPKSVHGQIMGFSAVGIAFRNVAVSNISINIEDLSRGASSRPRWWSRFFRR